MLELLEAFQGDRQIHWTNAYSIDTLHRHDRFNILDSLARLDNRNTDHRVIGLAEIFVGIQPVNATPARPIAAYARRGIATDLDQSKRFLAAIDKRTNYTRRAKVEEAADFPDV